MAAPDPLALALATRNAWSGARALVLEPPDGAEAALRSALDAVTLFRTRAGGDADEYGAWRGGERSTPSASSSAPVDAQAAATKIEDEPADPALARWHPDPAPYDAALVFLPKGTQRRDMMLAMAAQALCAGGLLAVVGERKAGIKPARKALAALGDLVAKHSGKHCQLHVARVPSPPAVETDPLARWKTRWEGPEGPMIALPGTFAAGRLDAGSALLLAHAEVPAGATLLDVACGGGVLGLSLAARHRPRRVVLSDVDHVACEAARRSLREMSLPGVSADVVAGDGYEALGAERFDRIVINPPFHQGIATEYEVARRLLEHAPAHLCPGGVLWVVANRFLPYDTLLSAAFARVEERADDGRFRIWRAAEPR